MSYTTKNGAKRIVKNGRVKIGGIYYYPKSPYETLPYDGRFEGNQLRFGRYHEQHSDGLFYKPFVCFISEDERLNIVDGHSHWNTWWADTDIMLQMLTAAPQKSSHAHQLRLWILRHHGVDTKKEPRIPGELWGETLERIFDRWIADRELVI